MAAAKARHKQPLQVWTKWEQQGAHHEIDFRADKQEFTATKARHKQGGVLRTQSSSQGKKAARQQPREERLLYLARLALSRFATPSRVKAGEFQRDRDTLEAISEIVVLRYQQLRVNSAKPSGPSLLCKEPTARFRQRNSCQVRLVLAANGSTDGLLQLASRTHHIRADPFASFLAESA